MDSLLSRRAYFAEQGIHLISVYNVLGTLMRKLVFRLVQIDGQVAFTCSATPGGAPLVSDISSGLVLIDAREDSTGSCMLECGSWLAKRGPANESVLLVVNFWKRGCSE